MRLWERTAVETQVFVRRREQVAVEQARRAAARTAAQEQRERVRQAQVAADAVRQAMPCRDYDLSGRSCDGRIECLLPGTDASFILVSEPAVSVSGGFCGNCGRAQRTTWVLTALAYGLLGLGLLGLIVSTAFVLAAVAPASTDWGKLSDISQTYGAVSVVLSAIALAGVALSLLYQVRQARTSNEQAIRDRHLQLATLALSDPNLLQAWPPPVAPVTLKWHRQHLITSLALGELLQRFRIGHLSVEKLAVKLEGISAGRSRGNSGNAKGRGGAAPWRLVIAVTVCSFAWRMRATGLLWRWGQRPLFWSFKIGRRGPSGGRRRAGCARRAVTGARPRS